MVRPARGLTNCSVVRPESHELSPLLSGEMSLEPSGEAADSSETRRDTRVLISIKWNANGVQSGD